MALPTTLKRQLLDNLYTVTDKAAATLPQTTTDDLFTISNGRVEVFSIVGEVTTVIEDQSCSIFLNHNPTAATASTAKFAQNLEIAAFVVGTVFTSNINLLSLSTGFRALLGENGIGVIPVNWTGGLVMTPGTIELETTANNTGATKWTIAWRPFDEAGSIAAA